MSYAVAGTASHQSILVRRLPRKDVADRKHAGDDDTSAEIWLDLQNDWDLWLAAQASRKAGSGACRPAPR